MRMTSRTSRRAASIALAGALVFGATGCSSDDTPEDDLEDAATDVEDAGSEVDDAMSEGASEMESEMESES